MSSIKKIKLTIVNERAITTSREIAYYFNKRHDNILRDIEHLDCSPQFNRLNFEAVDYKDSKGEVRKEYQITRDGFVYLVMGFTGKRAAQFKEAYIEAFNEMELKLHKRYYSRLQWGEPRLNDLLNMGHSVEKTQLEITHTRSGEIIKIGQINNKSISDSNPTVSEKPLWTTLVETFFNKIASGGISEKMRQNMLISKVSIALASGKKEQHDCLFFRPSNLMAFFHKEPRFYDLLNASGITRSKTLLNELNKAGVLAFNGKTKEKGIPIKPDIPLKTRRVPHLVALDLVVLKENYGIIMASNGGIAKILK